MIIRLPWPPKPLSPNARVHWRVLYNHKKAYKKWCYGEILAQGVKPLAFSPDYLYVQMTFVPPGNFAYDKDNLQASMKYGLDMIAKRLGVDDVIFWPLKPIVKKSEGKPGYVLVEIKENE